MFMKIMGSTLLIIFALLTGCKNSPLHEQNLAMKETLSMNPIKKSGVQVVGVIWLNPLHRKDYPTEWQTLWVMGIAKPNADDDMLRKKPFNYSTVKYVSLIADGNAGKTSKLNYHRGYQYELIGLLHDNYYGDPDYFYNVNNIKRKKYWRELAGIRVEYALPSKDFDAEAAGKKTQQILQNTFAMGNPSRPTLWTRPEPPDVRVTAGGPNAGFTSLQAAIDYLEAHPDRTAWAMSWDAPSRPLDHQINENLVVLVLAGPTYKTGRKALAWIARPETTKLSDIGDGGATPRIVQAWKATLDKASDNAAIKPNQVGYVIHDANNSHPDSSRRLGPLAQTLTTEAPDLDLLEQSFNTPALLGEMGAGSALTNVALAIGYANHFGKHVVVAGTTDPEQPAAVVVSPPAVVRPIDPDKPWFRARSMADAYLPWWGLRDDAPRYIQGYSK